MATLRYRDSSGEWKTLDYAKVINWSDISGKPTVFSPAEHQHAQSDIDNLEYELSSKIDRYIAPFTTVTYRGVVYTKWKFLDKNDISLVLNVNGGDLTVARFYEETGKFMLSLPTVLFDGEPGKSGVGPNLRLSGLVDNVQHGDFSDVEADLSTSKSSIADVMNKLNTVINILKGSTLALLISVIPFVLQGAVSVQRQQLSSLYESNPSKTYVVTNLQGAAAQEDLLKKQDKLPYPTNEIPYAVIKGRPDTSDMATKTWVNNHNFVDKSVTNGLASVSYVDEHTPGNYETVSNRAMTAIQEHQDISGKQDKLTAGDNVTLTNNVISVDLGIFKPWELRLDQQESIPSSAYRSAASLVSVTSVTNQPISIGSKAFAYLPYLKSISIGTVMDVPDPIANDAFLNLNLDSLEILGSQSVYMDWVGNNGFAGAAFNKMTFTPHTAVSSNSFAGVHVQELDLPGVTELPANMLANNIDLRKLHSFPRCYEIGPFAFYACTNLLEAGDFGRCLTIQDQAFCNCSNLKAIGSLEQCLDIQDKAFFNCHKLGLLRLGAVTNIGASAFSGLGTQTNTVILTRNPVTDFLASFKDSSGEICGLSHSSIVYCHDGYLVHSGSAWYIIPYTSTNMLPNPGFSGYTFLINNKYYRWNGGSYAETDIIGFLTREKDGSFTLSAPKFLTGDTVLKYEDISKTLLSGWSPVGTYSW